METKLDVNVDEINESLSMMFGDMSGGIVEMLENLPNNELSFNDLIYKALNTKDQVMKSMLPVVNGSYIEKIYLKEDSLGYLCEPFVKKDYKEWEHKIIECKNGLFGISPDLLKFFRSKVKENVEKIKVLKREMSVRNREYEVDKF